MPSAVRPHMSSNQSPGVTEDLVSGSQPGLEYSTPCTSRQPPALPPRSRPPLILTYPPSSSPTPTVSLPPFAPLNPDVIQDDLTLVRDSIITHSSSPSPNQSVIFCPSQPSSCNQSQYHPSPIVPITPSYLQPPHSLGDRLLSVTRRKVNIVSTSVSSFEGDLPRKTNIVSKPDTETIMPEDSMDEADITIEM